VFLSFNSIEFCQKYVYPTLYPNLADHNSLSPEPILTLKNYIFIWATFQLFITIYIALFVPEEDPTLQEELARNKSIKKGKRSAKKSSPRKKTGKAKAGRGSGNRKKRSTRKKVEDD